MVHPCVFREPVIVYDVLADGFGDVIDGSAVTEREGPVVSGALEGFPDARFGKVGR